MRKNIQLGQLVRMQRQGGFSLIELLIVVAIILIIAAIAIPNLVKARISANEASAVNSLRSITTAQITYKIFHPDIGYAKDLQTLGPDGERLLGSNIGSAPYQHSGYKFSTTGEESKFHAEADPTSPGSSGKRHFCTDTPSDIRYSLDPDTCVPGASPAI